MTMREYSEGWLKMGKLSLVQTEQGSKGSGNTTSGRRDGVVWPVKTALVMAE